MCYPDSLNLLKCLVELLLCQSPKRLLHERQVALHAVAEFGMSGLADQHVVRSWGGAGADTEQRIERGMPCPAPIEAEHELVEVVLEGGPPQSVVNAQAPALEI